MVNEVCDGFVSRLEGIGSASPGYQAIYVIRLAHDQLALDLIASYQLILASWPWSHVVHEGACRSRFSDMR